jgi:Flp pilus assembly protein TadG
MRRRRHVRAAGTALVELAVAAPFLLLLLTGAAQVGTVAYANVTVDTAAREGARMGSENPHTALDVIASPYTCAANDTNGVCTAARQASGALDPNALIIVITAPDDVSKVPPDVIRIASCPSTGATVTGVVSNLPVGSAGAVVMGSGGGLQNQVATDSSGNYTICLPPGGVVLTVTATGSNGCSYGSSSRLTVTAATSYTQNFALPTTCATPTPEPVVSPTYNPNATPAPSGTPVPGSSCPSLGPNNDTKYVTVTVKYRVPIFAPFIGPLFTNSPNGAATPYREVASTVTMRIEPCTITQGQ